MMKRAIPAFLALVLCLSLLSFHALAEGQALPQFGSVSGVATGVTVGQDADGSPITTIAITSEDGSQSVLLVDENAYWAAGEAAQVGDQVTGYYDATLPMTMIYPPQYVLAAVAVNPPADEMIKVDRFSGVFLISSDGALRLNPGEGAEVVAQDGSAYTGSLDGAALVVYYSVVTRSIPAETNPRKIVVLAGRTGEIGELMELTGAPILVEGVAIKSPDAFWSENGSVMVAVQPIAQALGMQYTYDAATGQVMVGKISFTVGQDGYAVGKRTPTMLGEAPVLKDGFVYVPLNFFTEVAGVNNAHFFEGQIEIDNGEKMN